MKEEEESFDFFELDKDRLDDEWVAQVSLYFKWGVKLANARELLERRKAALELTHAELDAQIRENPDLFGIGKITEPAVKSCVFVQEAYLEAQRFLNNAKKRVGILQVVQDTMDHRKKALEKLVDLRLADYYSEPRASPGAREQIDEARKKKVYKMKKRGE